MDAGERLAVAKFQHRTFEEDLNLKISLKHNTYTHTHTQALQGQAAEELSVKRQRHALCLLNAQEAN